MTKNCLFIIFLIKDRYDTMRPCYSSVWFSCFLKKILKNKRNSDKSYLNVFQILDIILWHIQKNFMFFMNRFLLSLVKYWWESFRISLVNHMSLMIYGLSEHTPDEDTMLIEVSNKIVSLYLEYFLRSRLHVSSRISVLHVWMCQVQ